MADYASLEHFTIRLTISCVGEVSGAFVSREEADARANDFPQSFEGTRGRLSENRLEFGETLFDWIEIGAVGRKIEKGCSTRLDCFSDACDLVNADVVHDDDVAALEGWNEDLFDVRREARAIHWPIQQQRCRDAIMA